VSLALPAALEAAPRRLSVDDVVTMALDSSPRLSATRSRAAAAHDTSLSAGARLLPSLHVANEYEHYDSPFDIAFSFGGSGATPAMSFPPVRARDQDTNTFSASVRQPLTGLAYLGELYLADRRDGQAAERNVKAAEAALREGVELEYLRLFEALAMEEVARASQAELAAQVKVTEAQVRAGTLTTADLLRVRVAEANARQQGIVAHTQGVVARGNVLSAIGLSPDDAEVELVAPTTLLEAAAPSDRDDWRLAQRLRPEVARAALVADSARHQRRARIYSLLPRVDAEFSYLRVDGQVFLPANSYFVGLRAEWAAWEWGAGFFATRAAGLEAEAAHAEIEVQKREVAVEVTSRRAQLVAATSAVGLARETIASAEEAYRVTDAQVRAGAATTTDLLDSQAALTQARLNLERARYEEAMARVSLTRALGR
jgi:outer membrane protein